MEDLSLADLKDILRSQGISTKGNKAELVIRLEEADTDGSIVKEWKKARDSDDRRTEEERRERDALKEQVRALQEALAALTARVAEDSRRPNPATGPPPPSVELPSRVSVSAIGELVGTFDGNAENFEIWTQQLQMIRGTYSLNDEAMRLIISSKLKGKALSWFHSCSNHLRLPIDELMSEIKKMFFPHMSKIRLRKTFENRVWSCNELFSEYAYEKVILANKANIDESELIDYIIEGIPDEALRDQARMQRFNTKDDLLCAFEKISLNKKSLAVKTKDGLKETSNKNVVESSRNNSANKNVTQNTSKSYVEKETKRCYNCSGYGHVAAACDKEKRRKGSCFRCSSMEHTIKDCPEVKSKKPNKLEISNVNLCSNIDSVFYPNVTLHFENDEGKFDVGLTALLDSGSPISFIKSKYVNPEIVISSNNESLNYHGINESKLKSFGKTKAICNMNDCTREIELLVVGNETMSSPMILGRDAFEIFGLEISKKNECSNGNSSHLNEIMQIEIEKDNVEDSLNINPEIPSDVKKQLINSFKKSYVLAEKPDEPKTKIELRLGLKNHQPFQFMPRRLSYSERSDLKGIIDDLLSRKIIRPSNSEYSSPIVLTKKKNGKTRMCIDYRVLNKYLESDNYPIPLIDDQIDVLKGKEYFSTIDLRDGFYHVDMAPDSVKYTSFVTPSGQYEFLKMPFGLKVAPKHFQKFVNTALKELIDSGDIVVYMDDVLVATKTIEHHIVVLRKLFKTLAENKLEVQTTKCHFLLTEVDYLGYKISGKGIKPSDRGIEAVSEFPIPKDIKSVQGFIGLVSYFRKFINSFSLIAKPLYDLLRKDSVFKFGTEQLEAFYELKRHLVSAPILAIFDPHAETELHCDASSRGFGAILLQRGNDRKMHPVFYFSKRASDTESRYHSFELEMLAIIYALRRFRVYLYGKKFKIVTDCNSLALALKKHEINPKISRWILELQNYDYATEHRSGTKMTHVDGLSRCNFVAIIEDNSFERNLAITQNIDKEIGKIKNSLEKTESKFFEMRNGIVYRKIGEKLLFYVPSEMEKNILFKYHDELGHLGSEKVIDIISKTYWFPHLRKKVLEHIKACYKCIAYNPVSGKVEGKITSIPKGDRPFETIHIDHVAITDARVASKKYVLVVVDGFTKHIKLYPAKSTKSKEAINDLKIYFSYYSKPTTIVTDRGSCFTSGEFTNFLNEFDIKHVQVATGSPQANGQVERANRTLAPMLGKLTDNDRSKNWTKIIADVEFTLNNSFHKTTNEIPSVLLFGVPQRGKVHDPIAEFVDIDVNKTRRDLENLREKAKVSINKKQIQAEAQANKKRKQAYVYDIGDYVMLKNFDCTTGISPKLKPKFKGPYQIIKALRNNRYVVADIPGSQVTQKKYEGVWEPANMRLWRKSAELD